MEVGSEPMRVQTLMQSGLSQVPIQYVQPPKTRPSVKSNRIDHIPVIDLSNCDTLAIGRACREWGAFQVTNHGVPIKLLTDMKYVGLTFFNDTPMCDKLTYAGDPSSAASEGYGSRMLVNDSNNTVLDWRDYFDHHTFPVSRRSPDKWPHFPDNYRETVSNYSDHMKILAEKLLGLISNSLGLDSQCIEERVGEIYQNITVSYYPPCPQPDLTLGLQAHSDFGAVTLLIQDDVGGLQVLKDGEWITVHPLENAIVVILADQTEIITNGEYRSAVHRAVTNDRKARLSVATFHDPSKTRKIHPVEEIVVGESGLPKYKEVVYGDYVSSWYTKGPEGKRNIDALRI